VTWKEKKESASSGEFGIKGGFIEPGVEKVPHAPEKNNTKRM